MTREEKENLLREAVDILIKLDNHLMTSRDNVEFSSWVEDLIDNYCEEEPKTGHWIEKDGFDGDTYYDCSECGESFCLIDGTPTDNLYNYCPNCGCRMVEPQEERNKE